jgi:PASTA domain-containing protein
LVKDDPPGYPGYVHHDRDNGGPRPKVLAALILAGLALLGLVVTLVAFSWGPEVPDVVGQTESEAERTVGNDYTIQVGSVRVEDQPKGTIINQDPQAGTSAEQGSAISVVVSAGQPPDPGDILSDDFTDTSSGWDESEGNKRERWVSDYTGGQYRIYMPPPAEPLPALRAGKPIKNGIVEVDATLQSNEPGTDAYWGVICRAQDKENYYVFRIGADRRALIWRKVDGRYTVLVAKGSGSEAVHGGKEINHLRADCLGSKLTFYVNDQKVAEVEDSTFDSEQVGLEVENVEDKPIEVRFDSYMVSSP